MKEKVDDRCTPGCPGWIYDYSNVAGHAVADSNGELDWIRVQRCDECNRYKDDIDAALENFCLVMISQPVPGEEYDVSYAVWAKDGKRTGDEADVEFFQAVKSAETEVIEVSEVS